MSIDAIEVTGLTKRYGKRRGVLDLDFQIHTNEVFGFLGPNGAGKTTTIRVLLGFLRPTTGSATVLGHDSWRDAAAAHVGVAYVSADPAYLGSLTAGEQLDYMARLRDLPKGAWRRVAERLELDPTVQVRKLSRGNRQKVGVVQVFMGREPLLIMDEPTSGLDPLMQREFLTLLSEARADGRTVFLSSHNLPEVERACDRVGIIREGRLVDITTVSDLQASHWRSVSLDPCGSPAARAVRPPQRPGHLRLGAGRASRGQGRREPAAPAPGDPRGRRHLDRDAGDRGRLPRLLRGAGDGRGRGGRVMLTAFGLELRRGRLLILWVGLVAMVYAGGITLFYPTILENAAQFEKLLEVYPKQLMAAFGIEGSLGDQGTFLNSYIFQFLWPLIAAIVAILLATRVAADADSGFLDLPLSTRLPRLRYLAASIAGQVVALGALVLMTVGAVMAVDLLIAPDFPTDRLLLAGLHALLLGAAIAGVTTLLAVIFLDRGKAGGIAAGILILMYLLNVLAVLSPDVADIGRLSAFRYFNLKDLIDVGTYPLGDSLLYLAVAAGGWLLALWSFRRRDLAA